MNRRISYKEFTEHPEYMDNDGPVYIVRDRCHRVLISEEEYEGIKETIYLLQNTIREGKGHRS